MKPFIRCAGGKGKVAGRLADLLGGEWQVYWEPFVGGGAVFFEIARRGLLPGRTVVLSDADEAVIELWRAVYASPDEVYAQAREWCEVVRWQETEDERRKAYDCLRRCWTTGADRLPGTQLALRTLAFNGLWRTNAKGKFNVPPDPQRLADPPLSRRRLFEASSALQQPARTSIFAGSALLAPCVPTTGWAIYCDPPYSKTWNKYGTDAAFTWDDQVELIRMCARWARAGARVVLSNNEDERLLEVIRTEWPEASVDRQQVGQTISGPIEGRRPRIDITACA